MSTEQSPPSPPPQSPPSPPPRRLPVGATLLPTDSDFVVMTEIVIEEGDLQHDLIKERSAYVEHPSVLLAFETPVVPLRREHVFIGTRKKQMKSPNEISFSRTVGDLGHWKQAGGQLEIQNDQGVATGSLAKYDFYESQYPGDKTGVHTCYRMKEYNSKKYPFNEKCIYTLEYLDKDRKEQLVVFERGLKMFFDCDSKPKAAAAAKKSGKATRNGKGKEKLMVDKENDETRVTEVISLAKGRFTRSQARHVKASPLFPFIPKKARGFKSALSDGSLRKEQLYPVFEAAFLEFLKGRSEVGEGSGVVKLVEGGQDVTADKVIVLSTVDKEGGRDDDLNSFDVLKSDREGEGQGASVSCHPEGREGQAAFLEFLKGRSEVAEGSGMVKLVEGGQDVTADKVIVLSTVDKEEGRDDVLKSDKDGEGQGASVSCHPDVIVVTDSDSEDEKSGCGSTAAGKD